VVDRDSLRLHLRFVYVRVRFTSLPRGFRFSNGPADDGESSGALTPARESGVPLYLPLQFKRSPFCVVIPRPSRAGLPVLPGSTFSPLLFSPRLSRTPVIFPVFLFTSPSLFFPWPSFPRSLFSGHVVIYSFNFAARGLPRIKYHVQLMVRI